MQSVIFSWDGNLPGKYEVQYKLSSAAAWSEAGGSPVSGLSLVIPNLADDTDYSFRVRTIGVSHISEWAYQSYKTSSPGCVGSSSVTTSGLSQNAVNLTWVAAPSAVNGYFVQWKKSSQLSWFNSTILSGTSYTVTGLTAGTSYDVRVVSICSGGGTANSGITTVITKSTTSLCAGISLSGLTVSAGLTQYSADWSNLGGTPTTHKLEYSTNGTVWLPVTSISSRGLTSVVYGLPLLGQYPKTHQLRVTPQCGDNSLGTPSTFNYTQPIDPVQYVTFENNLSTGTLWFINIDGSPNILTTPLGPGASKKYNQTGLLGATHKSFGKVTGVPIGTTLTILHTRGVTTLLQGEVKWDGFKFPFSLTENFQDGDIFQVL